MRDKTSNGKGLSKKDSAQLERALMEMMEDLDKMKVKSIKRQTSYYTTSTYLGRQFRQ